ncbi:MAG: Uma2 family endonuclease, partial [Blastocatellia bacterium]|nr:Uma2 family endonuclease [Blastocatellia bacterium]
TPDDVLLIIEVADTSAAYDREVKLPLYARAGIPEVWLVNLPDDQVEAHSQPVSGTYQIVKTAGRGESLAMTCLPNLVLGVDEILG